MLLPGLGEKLEELTVEDYGFGLFLSRWNQKKSFVTGESWNNLIWRP
jgi:hypothetical protein